LIYEEDSGRALDIAAAAVASLKEHNAPPYPPYFRLWYEYHALRNPALNRKIDELVASGTKITDEICRDLHERFFGSARAQLAVDEAAQSMQKNLTDMHGVLSTAGGDAARYGALLKDAGGKLKISANSGDLAPLIEQILGETETMHRQNKAIESKLQESAQEMARLRQELERIRRESMVDSITGLANRTYFDLFLADAVSQAGKGGEELSLLRIDIDKYREFAESWGGHAGDQILALLGRVLGETLKPHDLAARYGQHEFAAILPKTRLSNALTVGHVLRDALQRKKVVRKSTSEELGRVTISIGVAGLKRGEPAVELVRRCEVALSSARRDGGNRIVSQDTVDSLIKTTG
jgi:diguanylate cyclase